MVDTTPMNVWIGPTGGKPFPGAEHNYFTEIGGTTYSAIVAPTGGVANQWSYEVWDLSTMETLNGADASGDSTRDGAKKAIEAFFDKMRKQTDG